MTLAWEIAQSPCVVPIPGASRPQSVAASAAASEVVLAEAELAALDAS